MNRFLSLLAFFCLLFSSFVYAEDDYINIDIDADADEKSSPTYDLQEHTSRLNVITPEQYIEVTQPVEEEVRKTIKNLSEKEAKFLISLQNRINRRMAEQENQPAREEIDINATDPQSLKKMLTPEIYTYDDVPANF